jgi:hypothetical protein
MKAEIYTLMISDSAVERVHGCFRNITEVYVPSKKLAFNEEENEFRCFSTDRSRYGECTAKIGEIEIPKAMVQAMINYVNASKRMKKTKQWFKRCVVSLKYTEVKNEGSSK